MTLLQETRELQRRLGLLGAAQSTYDESKQLDDLRDGQITKRVAGIGDLVATRRALSDHGIAVAIDPPSPTLISKTDDLITQFRETPTKTTLTREKAWPALQKLVEQYLQATQKSAQTSWSAYCEPKVPTEEPAALKEDPELKFDPRNLSVLNDYEKLRRDLVRAKTQVPTTTGVIEKFDDDAARAVELLDSLKRNTPPAVTAFLEQMEKGPASLDIVSVDVLKWLVTENRTNEFVVRRRPG
ncbi:hypothetical protein QTI66_26160 [Variovorax sp. J22R133]|uniref:hypothetical protein n=1 Tax=Variovorax brevis TaxID=3053503 RepID=UPI002577686D|nr:hypothetical protein [Variovorax sp. J22R133]MDM0115661.1 hypothetical protein [Variovorax sp. J22R133]